MRWKAAGATDVGVQREHNEDSFCLETDLRLAVVADGMGGHRAGDVASAMATGNIVAFFNAMSEEDATWPFDFNPRLSVDENLLVLGTQHANQKIFETSMRNEENFGMGTTIVSALVSHDGDCLYLAHVGDSRAYRLREETLVQLTRDHSLVNDYMAMMPYLTEAQRAELPKNVITRALGMQDTVEVDLTQDAPQPGDLYLLCSDGLNTMVEDDLIAQTLGSAGLELDDKVQALINLANAHGGEDNVTVVLLAFS